MSYSSEDLRHEPRDLSTVSQSNMSRNSLPDKEKQEKGPVINSQTGGLENASFPHRPSMEVSSKVGGKPLQSRPIAPAVVTGTGAPMASISHLHFNPGPHQPHVMSVPLNIRSSVQGHPFASHMPSGVVQAAVVARGGTSAAALRTAPILPPVNKAILAVPNQVQATAATTVHARSPATLTPSVASRTPSPATVSPPTTEMRLSVPTELRPMDITARSSVVEVAHRASPHVALAPIHPSVNASNASTIMPVPGQKLIQPVASIPNPPKSVLSIITQPNYTPATTTIVSGNNSALSATPNSGSNIPNSIPASAVTTPTVIQAHPKLITQPASFPMTQFGKFPHQILSHRPPLLSADHSSITDQSRQLKNSSSSSNSTGHNPPSSTVAISSTTSGVVTDNRVESRVPQTMTLPHMYPMGFFFQDAGGGYSHSVSTIPQYHPSAAFTPLVRSPSQVATTMPATVQMMLQHAAAANAVDLQKWFIGNDKSLSQGSQAIRVNSDHGSASGVMEGLYSLPILAQQQQQQGLQPGMANTSTNSSSRPSILRKRTSEGFRKAQPSFAENSQAMPTSHPSETASSPRSDSTLSAPQSGQNSPNSKAPSESGSQIGEQSSTLTNSHPPQEATSIQTPVISPVKIKKEPTDNTPAITSLVSMASAASASMNEAKMTNSTPHPPALTPNIPNDVGSSPRKKPRKQNVVATEDKYGSSMVTGTPKPVDDPEKKKQEQEDEELKFLLLKRQKISIIGGYKVNTKAAHNHFQRYSDVKLKEERKLSIQDFAGQKGILGRASGWKVQHIAAQMDELSVLEQSVLSKMCEFRDRLPKMKPGHKHQDDIIMLHELVQGNIQRCQLVIEQISDTRKQLVKILDHQPLVTEILQKEINKRNNNKKKTS